MATVNISVATVSFEAPAGTVAGNFEIGYQDSNNVITKQDVATPSAVFANVAPGDYVALAVRLDGSGNAVGPQITQVFTVPAVAGVPVDVPNVVTVTLS